MSLRRRPALALSMLALSAAGVVPAAGSVLGGQGTRPVPVAAAASPAGSPGADTRAPVLVSATSALPSALRPAAATPAAAVHAAPRAARGTTPQPSAPRAAAPAARPAAPVTSAPVPVAPSSVVVQGSTGAAAVSGAVQLTPLGSEPAQLFHSTAPATAFGLSVYPLAGEDQVSALQRLTSQFGSLPALRIYSPGLFPEHWDDASLLRSVQPGTDVVYSFKADPTQVAAGAFDDRMRSFLSSRPAGVRVWVVYWHEVEDDIEAGTLTAAQFRAATAHLAPVISGAGGVPTTVLMEYTLAPYSHRDWHDYYVPGISVLAWDAYNTLGDKAGYKAPSDFVQPVLAVARETGKPFGWAELGSPCIASDPTCAGRARWLTALGSAIAGSGAQFGLYWDRAGFGSSPDYTLNDPASISAWSAVIHG